MQDVEQQQELADPCPTQLMQPSQPQLLSQPHLSCVPETQLDMGTQSPAPQASSPTPHHTHLAGIPAEGVAEREATGGSPSCLSDNDAHDGLGPHPLQPQQQSPCVGPAAQGMARAGTHGPAAAAVECEVVGAEEDETAGAAYATARSCVLGEQEDLGGQAVAEGDLREPEHSLGAGHDLAEGEEGQPGEPGTGGGDYGAVEDAEGGPVEGQEEEDGQVLGTAGMRFTPRFPPYTIPASGSSASGSQDTDVSGSQGEGEEDAMSGLSRVDEAEAGAGEGAEEGQGEEQEAEEGEEEEWEAAVGAGQEQGARGQQAVSAECQPGASRGMPHSSSSPCGAMPHGRASRQAAAANEDQPPAWPAHAPAPHCALASRRQQQSQAAQGMMAIQHAPPAPQHAAAASMDQQHSRSMPSALPAEHARSLPAPPGEIAGKHHTPSLPLSQPAAPSQAREPSRMVSQHGSQIPSPIATQHGSQVSGAKRTAPSSPEGSGRKKKHNQPVRSVCATEQLASPSQRTQPSSSTLHTKQLQEVATNKGSTAAPELGKGHKPGLGMMPWQGVSTVPSRGCIPEGPAAQPASKRARAASAAGRQVSVGGTAHQLLTAPEPDLQERRPGHQQYLPAHVHGNQPQDSIAQQARSQHARGVRSLPPGPGTVSHKSPAAMRDGATAAAGTAGPNRMQGPGPAAAPMGESDEAVSCTVSAYDL